MSSRQPRAEERLLGVFLRAAQMPWYRVLLDERGVGAEQIIDLHSFTSLCPPLTNRNTFDRFTIGELAATSSVEDLAGVLTSSGHGGRFSFGLTTKAQAARGSRAIDDALDAAFQVRSRTTLAINCLPMGVGFSSECMTIATTSVREDMAMALLLAFGDRFDQILLVADPLFMQRLIAYAAAQDTDWTSYRVQVILGEEIFGEQFRQYVSTRLGLDVDRPDGGYVMSSFGVGELGLHLLFETPATIALRRALARDAAMARVVLAVEGAERVLPMIFSFDPDRTFIEVLEPDAAGYGGLTISLLDTDAPIPLLRYQTGDRVRLLNRDEVTGALHRGGLPVPADLPACLLALEGREGDTLANKSHVGVYKDSLYADHLVAACLTGAFRIQFEGSACTMHVQLAAAAVLIDSLAQRIIAALPSPLRSVRLVLWPYDRFPFGMTLDYERKFSYYAGERNNGQGGKT
jgi:phenylacetate-CoA ligase